MRNALIQSLLEFSEEDNKIIFLTADLGFMAVEPLSDKLGGRFINCGVAEGNMIGVAGGLSANGFKPYCYTMAPFLALRGLEQIRTILCQNKYNVKLIGIGAGYSYGPQGPSHHSIEDLAPILSLPEMTVIVPADSDDVRNALRAIKCLEGPVYLRLSKAGEPVIKSEIRTFEFGKISIIREGEDLSIFTMGDILAKVVTVADRLKCEGISVAVYNCHTLKPFDSESVVSAALKSKKIFIVEQHVLHGGLSTLIAQSLVTSKVAMKRVKCLTIKDRYIKVAGSKEKLESFDELSEEGIYNTIVNEIKYS